MNKLLVFDYNGTARSGKGTIVKYLSQTYSDIATAEETGIDYRAITKQLLVEDLLQPGLAASEIIKKINCLDEQKLLAALAAREQLIRAYGQESLYEESVNQLVASVGQSPNARCAVKAGLKDRVKKICDEGHYKVLLLDGRNLSAVVKDIAGVDLRFRTFVTCSLAEAARRECLRKDIPINSPAAKQILKNLNDRIQQDYLREEDSVRPDSDALDYANPPAGADIVETAVRASRQIYFDTTSLSREQMLTAADQMFERAYNTTTN